MTTQRQGTRPKGKRGEPEDGKGRALPRLRHAHMPDSLPCAYDLAGHSYFFCVYWPSKPSFVASSSAPSTWTRGASQRGR
ncbi:uncharacterized protein SPSK_10182 [Sporothrix schenckii 1099-18]|uniref:Uncharacterized protein n=1 Tax=Sporothrix schenckii 1099-18 TaxID=1397361 RepID=A0A0F2M801_SPOSC|nr:uncharacterized protein SPSK_10182 [Sporothrix schenckii 1099-18]KJR84306.1 hypothetical protein SPSK_10182 [Sporothrix schenckii 1099-18]